MQTQTFWFYGCNVVWDKPYFPPFSLPHSAWWSEAEMLGSFRLLCPLLPSHPACRTHALLDRERETEMETRLLCSGLSKSHTSLGLNLFFCWKIAGEGNLEGRWVKGSLQSPSVLHFMCKFNFLYELLSSASSHTQSPLVTPHFNKFQV